jgi:hypothetical protein
LKKFGRGRLIVGGWVAFVGLVVGMQLLRLSKDPSPSPQLLRLDRGRMADKDRADAVQPTDLVLDDIRQKFAPTRRVEFQVDTSRDTSVFVLATGVQIRTPSGWQTVSKEYRGEIWRLKSGVAREVCVERPEADVWRAYVRYGAEMKGASLLGAQLKEAWKIRSFSNWTGKAWGGGRWSGSYELFSDEIAE